MLVWFEICEMSSNGDYSPAAVDHSDDLPGSGTVMLHQVYLTILSHKTDRDIYLLFCLCTLSLLPMCRGSSVVLL